MSELLYQQLRFHEEPVRYVADAEVHEILTRTPERVVDYFCAALRAIALGETATRIPPKMLFTDPDGAGDFRVMPSVVGEGVGARKTVKIVGTNRRQRRIADQITVGKAFVVDEHDNFVSHVVDACALSSARTGVCAAVAARILGANCVRVGIAGAGRVGIYAAIYLAATAAVESIVLHDPVPGRAEAAAVALRTVCPDVSIRGGAAEDLQAVDCLVLATDSADPIYAPGAHAIDLVISLGADIDDQSELDARSVDDATVYVDTMDSIRFGDLRGWLEGGLLREADITSLLDVLGGAAPLTGPKLFISTGIALFDNLALGYLLEQGLALPKAR